MTRNLGSEANLVRKSVASRAAPDDDDEDDHLVAARARATTRARIAYFSMEFGLDESLPIYSGGLGVLAGDHLKAAAELGVPLVGVGLLYRGGYFRQGIDADGRQTEAYEAVDPEAVGLVREHVTVERRPRTARRSRPTSGARTSARCRSTCSRSSG